MTEESAGPTQREESGAPESSGKASDTSDGDSSAGPEGAGTADVAVPESIRKRVAQYAAQVFHELEPTEVPPPLRFAQRWRRGALPGGFGERLVAALQAEDAFRGRIATKLIDTDPLATAVSESGPVDDYDEASVGAMLYLLRPEQWQERLRALLTTTFAKDPPDELVRAEREAADLRARLQRLQERRDRELATLREEAASTEARLSSANARLREQLSQEARGRREAEEEVREALRLLQDLQRELRRARSQVEQAKAASERSRSADKDARLRATSRAKMLLEVLQESVGGLADELGLPVSTPLPADLVPAVEPPEPSLPRRLHSSEELAQALTLPRCHLLVDGYNVSKGLWPNAPLQQQRDRLLAALGALQARTGAEVTVVFDGADVGAVPAVATKGVRVRFSEAGELADRVLVRLVGAEPAGRPVVVASSDNALASGARSAGARTVDRDVLCGLLPI